MVCFYFIQVIDFKFYFVLVDTSFICINNSELGFKHYCGQTLNGQSELFFLCHKMPLIVGGDNRQFIVFF